MTMGEMLIGSEKHEYYKTHNDKCYPYPSCSTWGLDSYIDNLERNASMNGFRRLQEKRERYREYRRKMDR